MKMLKMQQATTLESGRPLTYDPEDFNQYFYDLFTSAADRDGYGSDTAAAGSSAENEKDGDVPAEGK